jgi:hypothetical protein
MVDYHYEDRGMAIALTRPLAGPVPHPREVLKDALQARGLSAHALAVALRLLASRISQIVRSQQGITPGHKPRGRGRPRPNPFRKPPAPTRQTTPPGDADAVHALFIS